MYLASGCATPHVHKTQRGLGQVAPCTCVILEIQLLHGRDRNGAGYCLVVEHFSSLHKALGSMSNTEGEKNKQAPSMNDLQKKHCLQNI